MANETTIRLATDSREAAIPIEADATPNENVLHSRMHQLGHSFPSVNLRGMEIHSVSLQQTVDHLIQCSLRGVGGWIVTPNLDILRRHAQSVSFRNLVATSSLNVADGMPLVWISRLMGQPLPERVNGTDLMVDVCEASAKVGKSVFFLGGNRGAAEKTIQAMTEAFPDLNVAGCHCPEFGFENDVENIANIANMLSEAKPDIVFVGLGSPKQDVLINMLRLTFPSVWWLGVGVSFSFIAGELARAPDWAQKCGLEWLYRMIAEPERLAKRYLLQGIPFFVSTLLVAVYSRIFSSKS